MYICIYTYVCVHHLYIVYMYVYIYIERERHTHMHIWYTTSTYQNLFFCRVPIWHSYSRIFITTYTKVAYGSLKYSACHI